MNNKTQYFLRSVIGDCLTEMGAYNQKVIMITADLVATSRVKDFENKFPDRAFNVGIAEQNMVSFSAGLAQEGFIPYAFTMAPFISMRACEQCRTDVAYENLNVRLMGTYAGYSGGISGATHWALEDCAIMTGLPNMTVIELSDPLQARRIMENTLNFEGPIYIRTTVEPVPAIYDENEKFEIGKANIARDGKDGAFICSGVTVKYAVEASDIIKDKTGKCIKVLDVSTIKPIDVEAVIEATQTGKVIVAQDHNVVGGLGFHVANVIATNGIVTNFKILGCEDKFIPMAHAPYLYNKYGYDTDGLVKEMLKMLND